MSAFQGAVNTTINGGHLTAVSNTVINISGRNDTLSVLLSRSAPAGLLDAAERFDAPKCDEGTRVLMMQGMRKFVQQGDRPGLFWLHGPAGIGKSALAQSLALSLKDDSDHAASFFFSRTASGRSDGNQLIVTLAYQLAINFPALQPFISRTVMQNPAVLTASNAVKMQCLVVDPINRWRKKYKWSFQRWAHKILRINKKLYPRLILVDGLDECNDPQVQRDLLLCIGLAVQQLSLPIRFVVASRPEFHILATIELDPIFQGPHGVKVLTKNLGDDEDADQQVTTFLLKEFTEIRRTHPIREFLPQPWPLPSQIVQLVSKSSKGFIYPATVIRYIKMPNNRPDECLERILGLSEIPISDKPYEALDNLYHYIFESVPDANKEAIRNIFLFLVIPSNNLDGLISVTPYLIEKHFDYRPGHVQHVLRDLLCVVAFAGNLKPIKVLHASLLDFLLDRSRSGSLYIDPRDAHAAIAACFPMALSTMDASRLPDFRFTKFLKLVDVDFASRYMQVCATWSSKFQLHRQYVVALGTLLEGIAFVAAYLLLLVIKDVLQTDIRRHITQIKAYILEKSPLAAALYAVRDEFFPAMIPLFCRWIASEINLESITHIFAFEVHPSQHEIHEEIFELYFLMMAPFLGSTSGDKNHSQNVDRQPRAQQLTNYSIHISRTLLDFLLIDCYRPSPVKGINILTADLLGVSLAHADYSASLTELLDNLFSHIRRGITNIKLMWVIAPHVSDYLERVYWEGPVRWGQQEVLGLNNAWRQLSENRGRAVEDKATG
ncbi:hypothetical protein D9619_004549 [Psilocybe cf. subviscida]|uniref:Nephrocystin 3-like N-terminal domain-containing protein n=1 Tax=Psilocybe cf. subviscida TaxID=2480587 RepID=A0A8H5BPW2_9AGAR|nr:hypothetical protein D9619_004549 [Psilocybe cf. subviscida]